MLTSAFMDVPITWFSDLFIFKLQIRFRKNLAKLTGSAVRINSKKPKGKKMKKKNTGTV